MSILHSFETAVVNLISTSSNLALANAAMLKERAFVQSVETDDSPGDGGEGEEETDDDDEEDGEEEETDDDETGFFEDLEEFLDMIKL